MYTKASLLFTWDFPCALSPADPRKGNESAGAAAATTRQVEDSSAIFIAALKERKKVKTYASFIK